ncbi:hypothetical protein IAR50_006862 [Cryptococcus sp. DSM 104548]
MNHTNPYNSSGNHILPTLHAAPPDDPASPTSPSFPQYSPFAPPSGKAIPSFPTSTDKKKPSLLLLTRGGNMRHLSVNHQPVPEVPKERGYDLPEAMEEVLKRVDMMDVGICLAAVATVDSVAVAGFALVWILVSQGKSSLTHRLCTSIPYSVLSAFYVRYRRKHNNQHLSDLSRVIWQYGEDAVKGVRLREVLGMFSWVVLSAFWVVWAAVILGVGNWYRS